MGNKINKQSQLGKANAELEAGNYNKAIQMLKEELKFRPRSVESLRLLLKANLRLYEIDKAEEVCAKFYSVAGLPEDLLTKSIFIKELFYCDEGKARGIGRELQQLMERQKNTNAATSAQCNRSQLHQPSIAQQQQASSYNNNTFIQNQSINYNNSSTTEVSTANNEGFSFSRGMIKFLSSSFDEAINLFENEILIQGQTASSSSIKFDCQMMIVYCYIKQRCFKQGQQLLSDSSIQQVASQSKDKSYELKLMTAELQGSQGKVDACIEQYLECLEAIPYNSYLMYKLFNLYLKTNDLKSSRLQVEKALKTRPSDSLCYKMQGDHYLTMKDSRSASKLYEKGLMVNKRCFRCLEALGDMSSDQRLVYFEKCSKVSPYYTDIMIKIGVYYMQHSDDYLEALRWFFKALEYRTSHRLIYFYIARSYYQNDQYEYSLKNLAISLNLTYEKTNEQLSQAVKILNKYSEFFSVEAVQSFIEQIRFKYYQYFQTISQNLENVKFARLFSSFVYSTQVHLQYFALYKFVLSTVNAESQIFSSGFGQISSSIPLDNKSVDLANKQNQSKNAQQNYLLRAVYTPINKEAVKIAEKYFFDLFNEK